MFTKSVSHHSGSSVHAGHLASGRFVFRGLCPASNQTTKGINPATKPVIHIAAIHI